MQSRNPEDKRIIENTNMISILNVSGLGLVNGITQTKELETVTKKMTQAPKYVTNKNSTILTLF